jgi:hypothetical protein
LLPAGASRTATTSSGATVVASASGAAGNALSITKMLTSLVGVAAVAALLF